MLFSPLGFCHQKSLFFCTFLCNLVRYIWLYSFVYYKVLL